MRIARGFMDRMLDWYFAGVMIVLGGGLALPGPTLTPLRRGGYFTLSVNEEILGLIMLLFGVAWVLLLVVNGFWRRSPSGRALCCIAAAGCWGALGSLYWQTVAVSGAGLLLALLFSTMAIFSLFSCYRSAVDARDA